MHFSMSDPLRLRWGCERGTGGAKVKGIPLKDSGLQVSRKAQDDQRSFRYSEGRKTEIREASGVHKGAGWRSEKLQVSTKAQEKDQ